jgi:hypothetical protein
VAEALGAKHLDADDFGWAPSEPPFMHRIAPAERWAMFTAAIAGVDRWVLSGSLLRWDDEVMGYLDLVVFLRIPQAARINATAPRSTPAAASTSPTASL